MITKLLISTLVFMGGMNLAQADDNDLFRIVCFDIWSDTENRKGKVFVIDLANTDVMSSEEFFSGENISRIEVNVTVFRNVEQVRGVYHPSDLNINALEFSNQLFSSHENQVTYPGSGQSGKDGENVGMAFGWYNDANQPVGGIGTGLAKDARGTLSERYGPQNPNNDSSELGCLPPVTISPESEQVATLNEETIEGTNTQGNSIYQ